MKEVKRDTCFRLISSNRLEGSGSDSIAAVSDWPWYIFTKRLKSRFEKVVAISNNWYLDCVLRSSRLLGTWISNCCFNPFVFCRFLFCLHWWNNGFLRNRFRRYRFCLRLVGFCWSSLKKEEAWVLGIAKVIFEKFWLLPLLEHLEEWGFSSNLRCGFPM